MNAKPKQPKNPSRIYTLRVFLIAGLMSDDFEDREISRTIQIKGSQTLKYLHCIIFKAFDRFDEHLYEFNLGKGTRDRSRIYSLHIEGMDEDDSMEDVAKTTIDSLKLKVDRAFGYRFDFGDEWWHQINVIGVKRSRGRGRYPKVVERVGVSPPQYPDVDE